MQRGCVKHFFRLLSTKASGAAASKAAAPLPAPNTNAFVQKNSDNNSSSSNSSSSSSGSNSNSNSNSNSSSSTAPSAQAAPSVSASAPVPGTAATCSAPLISSTIARFDTLDFAEQLEKSGFTRKQSEIVMRTFSDVLSQSVSDLRDSMVTKADHERNIGMYKIDFTALRSEFKMQERHEFNLLKGEMERISGDLERSRQRMREEIGKLQASVRLDMSLERGRIRDDSIVQEAKIRDSDARIETEISNIRTQLEGIKFEIVRNIIGIMTAAAGLVLAYINTSKRLAHQTP